MIISYGGASLIKIQATDTVIAVNPPRKEARSGARFGADITLISLRDPLFDGTETTTFAAKEPFVVDGPGEYEIKNIYIKGVLGGRVKREKTASAPDGERINTVYTILLDGIRLCHIGGESNAVISPAVKEEIGGVDILFVPIAGKDVLDAEGAYKVATALEARVVVPLMWEDGRGKNPPLGLFLKEFGSEEAKPVSRYVPKRKELDQCEGEVVVFSP